METLTINIPENVEVKTVKAVLKALGVSFGTKAKNGVARRQKEKPYDPEYVAMVQESQKQFEEGRYTVIKTEDLWK